MKSLAIILMMPIAPLLAALVAGVMRRERGRLASSIVTCSAGAALVAAFAALFTAWMAPGAQPMYFGLPWIQAGALRLEIGFLLDVLSASMAAVVALVSFLVMIYARSYMADDPRHGVFFAYLGLFEGAMLGLVLSNSLLQLFMFWELVGLASYLLVGFWHEKPAAAAAARKAFLTTRIGDVALLFGMLLLFVLTGTVAFHQQGGSGLLDPPMLAFLKNGPAGAPVILGNPMDVSAAEAAASGSGGGIADMATRSGFALVSLSGLAMLLIFLGAAGKSGQFPLHVWLPDAMEGPTPVSALIHAATMVAAGIYLMARMAPVLALDNLASAIAATFGAVTLILGGLLALGQSDIKRVLAFSTISQLGLMMVAVTYGSTASAMMHLTTHAFFKSLLFLSAGVLIHQLGSQDIREMGSVMPNADAGGDGTSGNKNKRESEAALTIAGKAAFLIGLICLADFPVTFILAQVSSKEMVLHDVNIHDGPDGTFASMLTGALLIGSVLTALYATRLAFRLNLFSIFGYRRRDNSSHSPESEDAAGTVPPGSKSAASAGAAGKRGVRVSGRGRLAQSGSHTAAAHVADQQAEDQAHKASHNAHRHHHRHDRFRIERDLALLAPLALLSFAALILVPMLSLTHGLEVWEMGMHHLQSPAMAAAERSVGPARAASGVHGLNPAGSTHGLDFLTSLGLASVGIGLLAGVWLFRDPASVISNEPSSTTFRRALAPIGPALRNRFYLDELYAATAGRLWSLASGASIFLLGLALLITEFFVFLCQCLSRLATSFTDRVVLDSWIFDGSCHSLKSTGGVTTKPENGYLPGHLRWYVVGVVVLALAVWVARM